MAPDSTPNPALHRFLDAATRRAVDALAALPPPESDPVTQQLLAPPLPALPPAAADALTALPTAFPVTLKVGAATGRTTAGVLTVCNAASGPGQIDLRCSALRRDVGYALIVGRMSSIIGGVKGSTGRMMLHHAWLFCCSHAACAPI